MIFRHFAITFFWSLKMVQYQFLESAVVGYSMVSMELSQIAQFCYLVAILFVTLASIGCIMHASLLYHNLVWYGSYNGKFVVYDQEKWDQAMGEILDRYKRVFIGLAFVFGLSLLLLSINTEIGGGLIGNLNPTR